MSANSQNAKVMSLLHRYAERSNDTILHRMGLVHGHRRHHPHKSASILHLLSRAVHGALPLHLCQISRAYNAPSLHL